MNIWPFNRPPAPPPARAAKSTPPRLPPQRRDLRLTHGPLSGSGSMSGDDGRVRPQNPYGFSGDTTHSNLPRLRGYSRALMREYEFGGWARRLRDAVISGEPRPPRFDSALDRDAAAAITDAWMRWWCGPVGVDGAGTDGATQERAALWSLIEDGDAFALPYMTGDMLAVEVRNGGDLADWRFQAKTNRGRQVYLGVELDDRRRAIAFWFRKTGNNNLLAAPSTGSERVAASELIHIFDALGTDSFRGVPWITPALAQVLKTKDADIATMRIIKLMSRMALTIEEAAGAVPAYGSLASVSKPGRRRDDIRVDGEADAGGDDDDEGAPTEVVIDGDIIVAQLPPGHSLKANPPTSGDIRAFRERIMQSVSAALNMSYARVTGDATGASYSSLRAGEVDDITFAREVHALWIKRWRRPLFQRWLIWAAATGRVTLPTDAMALDAARMPIWTAPRRLWVDPQKEAAALRQQVEGGWLRPSEARERDGATYDADLDAALDAAWLARQLARKNALDKPSAAGAKMPSSQKPTQDLSK